MSVLLEAGRLLHKSDRNRTLASLPLIALALDAALIFGVVGLAMVGRSHLGIFANPADVSSSVIVAGPLLWAAWIGVLAVMGAYRVSAFGAGTQEYQRILNASVTVAGLTGVTSYLTKFELSRGFFVLTFALGVPALVLGRMTLRKTLQVARQHGMFGQRVLVAGAPGMVDEVAGVLTRERWLGYEIVGALTPATFLDSETAGGIPVLGTTDELTKFATTGGIDAVFLAGGAIGSSEDMRRLVWDLEHERVQVIVAPSVTDVSKERVRIRPVGGLPLVHIDPPSAARAARWGKRTFDVVGSFGLLLAFSPVFLWAALQIKLHDRGPVLFRQTRIGRSGGEFSCLKFRTMVVDAEERLAALHLDTGHTDGLFKMKDDPRITKPGRWLRRYSMDELPQLLNVFRGEMSLVGPRPPLPREVAHYSEDGRRRLRVRPGMTGLWQVSGRSDLSWSESVRLDLYYVDNWSMIQDLNILGKTFGAVLGSRGAY